MEHRRLGFDWGLVPAERIKYCQSQTELFIAAYNLPVRRKIEELSPKELRALLRRFIRYKSTADPRVRRRLEPVPKILGPADAQRIASDIIEVAHFFNYDGGVLVCVPIAFERARRAIVGLVLGCKLNCAAPEQP